MYKEQENQETLLLDGSDGEIKVSFYLDTFYVIALIN